MGEWGANTTHRTQFRTQGAPKGIFLKLSISQEKEEGAPETLHQNAEPPGHLQMVVPIGAPIHLLPHSYGGVRPGRDKRKSGSHLTERKRDHAGPT